MTLLLINLYGLTQTLRPAGLAPAYFRFGAADLKLSQASFRREVERYPDEPNDQYVNRLTTVIADGMAHIHWPRYEASRFNQRVPLWENYILWAMSYLTSIPEYERYHFTDPQKSIERGIGICGDASILMSRMLDKNSIDNRIVTIPGHVLIEASLDGGWSAFDPDYGVVLGLSASSAALQPQTVKNAYLSTGHSPYDADFVASRLQERIRYWGGVDGFIGKKYYFEKFAYFAKWCLPAMLILASALTYRVRKRR
ncbi:hypothetical protein N9H37_01490 [Congregibacter sp.]|nr:hypothetical protein [Congregibacter sp.]MDA8962013.1 hypothetical protein [Congregibacter sp.]